MVPPLPGVAPLLSERLLLALRMDPAVLRGDPYFVGNAVLSFSCGASAI